LGGKLEFGWDYMYERKFRWGRKFRGYNNNIYSSKAKQAKP